MAVEFDELLGVDANGGRAPGGRGYWACAGETNCDCAGGGDGVNDAGGNAAVVGRILPGTPVNCCGVAPIGCCAGDGAN